MTDKELIERRLGLLDKQRELDTSSKLVARRLMRQLIGDEPNCDAIDRILSDMREIWSEMAHIE